MGELFSHDELIEQDIEISMNTESAELLIEEIDYGPANLSANAKTILEKRYLKKNEYGETVETPKELFLRVAKAVAEVDNRYGGDVDESEHIFYRMMASLDFLPNSPTLMNAGRDLGQLSACFVLPVEDSMDGIFETVKNTALIHKSGGGTGFSFSRLRPKNSMVKTTAGTASGPVSFMQVFNAATETVKQGGTRRGANMAILRVDHPDIAEFINCKSEENALTNFNLSVALTDQFMKAVVTNDEYDLVSPHNGEIVSTLSAREVFDKIVENAWNNGEPGIVFIDKINEAHPVSHLGQIESTNPCGEQPLLPYESCNLGSINLDHMVRDGEIDWDKLRKVTHHAVHFLDNVIDANKYPLEKISEITLSTRKIGLGVMGFADLLYQIGVPYDSDEGVQTAGQIMSFIREEARFKSKAMSQERGVYPAWREGSAKMRNSTVTTIAPTGTISMIADASSGIEPNFDLAFTKIVLDGRELKYLNKRFRETAEACGFYSDDLVQMLIRGESIDNISAVPKDIACVFRTSKEIDVSWHIKMQAAFQKHTDNAVSKTINFPNTATVDEIRKAYLSAYQIGCKGLTVYRDGSRKFQVLKSGKEESTDQSSEINKISEILPTPRRRPRTTRGLTERVNTGEGMLYVTINEDMEGLCEVFATIGKHGGNAAAQSEAISRLISLCLRCGIGVKSIIKQLKSIAGPNPVWDDGQLILSTPDAIGKVLERYVEKKPKNPSAKSAAPQQDTLIIDDEHHPAVLASDTCPDCGVTVYHGEGCMTCHSCGYSRC